MLFEVSTFLSHPSAVYNYFCYESGIVVYILFFDQFFYFWRDTLFFFVSLNSFNEFVTSDLTKEKEFHSFNIFIDSWILGLVVIRRGMVY